MKPKDWSTPASMIQTIDLGSYLRSLSQEFAQTSDTPALDAQVLAAHVLRRPRAWLLAHPEEILEADQVAQLDRTARRLVDGEPLPYILGKWEFYGLNFEISPAVLIPRPETELLVEKALEWLSHHPEATSIVDVGTGSGCIAVTIAVHASDRIIFAGDRSRPALEIASRNIIDHGVSAAVHLFQADLLDGLKASFDLVCANLPYIPTPDLANLKVAAHEPGLALDGGPGGLAVIRRLLHTGPRILAPRGLMLLEIEAGQGLAVIELARAAFPQAIIQLYQDLNHCDRVLAIQS